MRGPIVSCASGRSRSSRRNPERDPWTSLTRPILGHRGCPNILWCFIDAGAAESAARTGPARALPAGIWTSRCDVLVDRGADKSLGMRDYPGQSGTDAGQTPGLLWFLGGAAARRCSRLLSRGFPPFGDCRGGVDGFDPMEKRVYRAFVDHLREAQVGCDRRAGVNPDHRNGLARRSPLSRRHIALGASRCPRHRAPDR